MKKRCLSGKQKGKLLRWEDSAKFLLSICLSSVAVHADISTGLIGGTTNSSDAYSAFISSDGTAMALPDLSFSGQINGVALNNLGAGLIGGQDAVGGYAAFVSPGGGLSVLDLDLASGAISSTSINSSGNGVVGGNDGSGNMYAALVAQDGTITSLSASLANFGFIHSTALNDDGIALIGGEGGTNPFAAYVTPIGVVTQIDTSTLSGGHFAVALNDQGNGIIGGSSTFGAYAAFVTPSTVTPSPLSPLPSGFTAFISSVAINNSGIGLIGGNDDNSNMYAGYATDVGALTPLFDNPDPGQIVSVAINSSGTGLIGGYSNSNLYAALVQPDGSVNTLFSGSDAGSINTVAINDKGVGLIGGQIGASGYAALVAPNGALTVLDMTDQSSIASVALHNDTLLDSTTPHSAGPYSSTTFTQLAAVSALEYRFIEKNKIWQAKNIEGQANVAYNDMNLLASSDPNMLGANPSKQLPSDNSIWVAPFGNLIYLKEQGSIPKYSNEITGILIGYDRQGSNYLVGGALGYAFNYVGYSNGMGHGKINEEMANIYGAYYSNNFWLDVAVWGGYYQFSNTRHTLSMITSKGKTHGWILSPHLEMASPWGIDKRNRYFIEPFFALDWVNNWQNHYTESGAAGFNLKMNDLYGSLLQSEVGLRFYENFAFGWGNFCLEEKISYVNQAPFNSHSATTSFVSSASSFPIAVSSSKVQNLAAAQMMGSFVPKNSTYPYGGFNVQVTANDSYQSYYFSVFTGKNF